MVNLEQLRTRGLHAYEVGRLRMALRVAVIVVPMAALCLIESRGREASACFACLLLGLAVWFRWRDRRGMENVTTGLLAGSIPLLAGLTLDALELRCGLAGGESLCTAFSVIIGAAAGLVIVIREGQWQSRLSSLLMAGAIAVLAAGLGCIRLGVLGTTSMVLGIALGSAVGAGALWRSRR